MNAGRGPPIWPRKVSTSLPQMPLASTRSRPSSAPVVGRGNSRSSIWPGATWTAARTMSVINLYLSCRNGGARPAAEQSDHHRDAGVACTRDGDQQMLCVAAGQHALEVVRPGRFARATNAIVVAGVLADAGQLCGGPAGPVSEESPDRGAVETSAGQQLGVLGAKDNAGRCVPEDPGAGPADRIGEVRQQLLSAAGMPVVYELASAQQRCADGGGARR